MNVLFCATESTGLVYDFLILLNGVIRFCVNYKTAKQVLLMVVNP